MARRYTLLVLLVMGFARGDLLRRRSLQDLEMISSDEAAQLEEAELAQREKAEAEAQEKLAEALKAAEEAKMAAETAKAKLATMEAAPAQSLSAVAPAEADRVSQLATPLDTQPTTQVESKGASQLESEPSSALEQQEKAPKGIARETAEANDEPTPALTELEADAQQLLEKLNTAMLNEETLLASLSTKLKEILDTVPSTGEHETTPGAADLKSAEHGTTPDSAANRKLSAATWNMAAINNNPFEYWVTYEGDDGAAYYSLMDQISEFLSSPGEDDVQVSTVFTDDMFKELMQAMDQASLATIEEIKKVGNDYWATDYSKRTIVDGILKDAALGSKRLVSMPDRVTNTIQLADGTKAMRPTVINCYNGELPNLATWWQKWRDFMFGTKLKTSKEGQAKMPIAMLPKISKSKYPKISTEEEALSIPLSATLLAVFDATLVHIVNQASSDWQHIREAMCQALNDRKNERTAEILETPLYNDLDIVFLQESSMTFAHVAEARALGTSDYDIYAPREVDPSRDQNSLILLRKERWSEPIDVTADVRTILLEKDGSSPIALGDLCVYQATRLLDGKKYILASFHGDTNGIATVPVVEAVHNYISGLDDGASFSLLFGLDANTHYECLNDDGDKYRACVTDFVKAFKAQGINSCYGDSVTNPHDYAHTTFNARTYLQPQLNKAVKESEKTTSPLVDKNPKDFILFYDADLKTSELASKDNTGEGTFLNDIVFPTLTFPSDHAITKAVLVDKKFEDATETA